MDCFPAVCGDFLWTMCACMLKEPLALRTMRETLRTMRETQRAEQAAAAQLGDPAASRGEGHDRAQWAFATEESFTKVFEAILSAVVGAPISRSSIA